MRYLLMICGEPPDSDLPAEELYPDGCGGWSEEMERRGIVVGGAGLGPASEAATVRVRDGEVLVSDGPFAETKEQIGGYCVIECADLDEALEVAAKHPFARLGSVEVRPVEA
ncbi:YciI family protein [Amycolatopsis suaedae]|uniref:Transcription initiation protein n=1 Tax=Amycolatopsis suaedae TaxID=2510978 RepID=A0A4Q7IXJ6_9PSEU|nr:YciI family protein [Amycolatopsis suaedae]RZQ59671.1 transcription initiation protein [Amycolatopsis suaedae]